MSAVGRPRQYRNAADKQKAYRDRQREEKLVREQLKERLQALRNSCWWLKNHRKLTPSIEVYQPMVYPDELWYKLMAGGYDFGRLDQETFQAIECELTLFGRSRDTKRYHIRESFYE